MQVQLVGVLLSVCCAKGQGTMADTGSGVTEYPVLVITLIVGATVLVLVYISSLLRSSKGDDDAKSKEIITADTLRHGIDSFKCPLKATCTGERLSGFSVYVLCFTMRSVQKY